MSLIFKYNKKEIGIISKIENKFDEIIDEKLLNIFKTNFNQLKKLFFA